MCVYIDRMPELDSYSRVIVAFSGGKDSVACVLHLLELGVPRERIELWHHDVDGREGSTLMDWPCTRAYCREFAAALGLRILFSWKQGGLEGEMLREDAYTRPISWENPDGSITTVGGDRGKLATRRKFPQVSPDLSVRWCSAYLKIDVCSRAINGSPRFIGECTLVVTGERAQESAARARYAEFEPHRADNRQDPWMADLLPSWSPWLWVSHACLWDLQPTRKRQRVVRHVDAWRPVHSWSEREVWQIMKRWRVRPHPCYLLGFSRCSCMPCIFGNADQWATVRTLDPQRFEKLATYEAEFGVTLKRKLSLPVIADQGTPYAALDPEHIAAAMSHDYALPGLLSDLERWSLPAGAFGESCGPS